MHNDFSQIKIKHYLPESCTLMTVEEVSRVI